MANVVRLRDLWFIVRKRDLETLMEFPDTAYTSLIGASKDVADLIKMTNQEYVVKDFDYLKDIIIRNNG